MGGFEFENCNSLTELLMHYYCNYAYYVFGENPPHLSWIFQTKCIHSKFKLPGAERTPNRAKKTTTTLVSTLIRITTPAMNSWTNKSKQTDFPLQIFLTRLTYFLWFLQNDFVRFLNGLWATPNHRREVHMYVLILYILL